MHTTYLLTGQSKIWSSKQNHGELSVMEKLYDIQFIFFSDI